MKERLKTFIASLGITIQEFEREVGRPNGYINNVGDGMSTRALSTILKRYPQLDAVWLMMGEGEMLRRDETSELRRRLEEAETTIATLREVNRQQNNIIEAWQVLRQ